MCRIRARLPIIPNRMETGAVNTNLNMLNGVASTDGIKTALQVRLLQKNLEAQKEQSQELLNMIEQKGQRIDIRV